MSLPVWSHVLSGGLPREAGERISSGGHKAGSVHAFLFIAGSLESAYSSILAVRRLYKDVVGKFFLC